MKTTRKPFKRRPWTKEEIAKAAASRKITNQKRRLAKNLIAQVEVDTNAMLAALEDKIYGAGYKEKKHDTRELEEIDCEGDE